MAEGMFNHKQEQSAERFRPKHFNWFDIAVVVLAVVLIGASLWYFYPRLFQGKNVNARNADITLVFENVDDAFADRLATGDVLLWTDSQQVIGTVKEVSTENAATVGSDAQGQLVKQPLVGKKTVMAVVRVEKNGVYSVGEGFSVNGQIIRIGENYRCCTVHFSGECRCIDFQTEESK